MFLQYRHFPGIAYATKRTKVEWLLKLGDYRNDKTCAGAPTTKVPGVGEIFSAVLPVSQHVFLPAQSSS